jgi:hypothetical protein
MSEISDDEREDNSDHPLNFSQFYFIIHKISGIVYEDLARQDGTVALNKLLIESILPMYVWTQVKYSQL